MKELEKHIAPKQETPVRLSDYVVGIFTTITSKKGMKKAIEKGLVTVNGHVSSTGKYINGGETIALFASEEKSNKPTIRLDIDVLWEDEYLAVVLKPAGIVVSGNKKHTLENALPISLKATTLPDALPRPQPAHRLDYPTSGLVLIGKTAKAVTALSKLFEHRHIDKTYHAIIQGVLKKGINKSGNIETTLKGKQAITDYTLIQTIPSPKFTELHLTELKPTTGRRHQLRIHMAEMGNPILGDQKYGEEGKVLLGNGLYLHASSLAFVHPFTQEKISVSTPLPNKFNRLLANETLSKEEE